MNENEVVTENMTQVWFQMTGVPRSRYSKLMTPTEMDDRFNPEQGWYLVDVSTIPLGDEQILTHQWASSAAHLEAWFTTVTPRF